MPLDNSFDMGPMQSPPSEDWGFNRAKWWEFRFCWLPKKCYLTDKPLWGQRAYHGENWVTGPDEPVVEHYWIERDKFVLWQLTRKHYGTI